MKTNVCVTQTVSVSIMATGRIELGPTGMAVAANVKRLREARGLSLRALSKRMDDTGRRVSADALNKIENGANPEAKHIRRVDVDDLLALSVALGVSPVTLLLPSGKPQGAETDPRREWLTVTGGSSMPWETAWRWMHGEFPPADVPPREVRRFREENRPYEDENPVREVETLMRSRVEGAWHLEMDYSDPGMTSKLTRRSSREADG